MTYDEFLDREKARGVIVYRCAGCDFRGMGGAVTYHERRPGHACYNEDRERPATSIVLESTNNPPAKPGDN